MGRGGFVDSGTGSGAEWKLSLAGHAGDGACAVCGVVGGRAVVVVCCWGEAGLGWDSGRVRADAASGTDPAGGGAADRSAADLPGCSAPDVGRVRSGLCRGDDCSGGVVPAELDGKPHASAADDEGQDVALLSWLQD